MNLLLNSQIKILIKLNNLKINSSKKQTCLIGIRLIDGVICPSWSKLWREFCNALLIKDWELVGALESAEWGDGEPPFKGLFIVDGHAWISSAELMLAGMGSDCTGILGRKYCLKHFYPSDVFKLNIMYYI